MSRNLVSNKHKVYGKNEAWWNKRHSYGLQDIPSHLCKLLDSLRAGVRLGQETSTQIIVNWKLFRSEAKLICTSSYTRNVCLNAFVLGVLVNVFLVVRVHWGTLQEGWGAVKISVYPLDDKIDMDSLVFLSFKFQQIKMYSLWCFQDSKYLTFKYRIALW